MIWKTGIVLLVLAVLLGAVKTRINLKRTRSLEKIENAAPSPASVALAELVAIAGGVYLSLVLLTSFLDMSVPDRVRVLNMTMDPLALIAILIALVQPFLIVAYYKMFGR
ncbi:MAG: hypothetical protein QHH10_02135 [Peptococcaceae bacterium]|jgi:Ni,Fe-hydrogenase III small subunit|nr:hypothetical protein [Peptococcaceae bacterium]MDH7524097.1 hypothetical protein [Peptococcaceae bacterium]